MARKTLAERNAAAYAPKPTTTPPAASAETQNEQPATPQAQVTPITQAPGEKTAAKKAPAKKTAAKKTATSTNTRRATRTGSVTTVERPDGATAHKISIHVPKDVWQDSRRAYCATILDEEPGRPTSHSEWVENAVLAHIERGPAARKTAEDALPEPQLSGTPRPVYLAETATDAIAEALPRDRQVGLWRARSGFIVEAIHVAVEDARARRGGELPEAPKRIPRQAVKTTRRASSH